MNNTTKRTLTAAAILMAATLVVGTFATTTTIAQPASAAYGLKKRAQGNQTRDNNGNDNGGGRGNGNGNTVTIEECKNRGSASGFDTAVNQECENLICIHPGNNATCSQEGAVTPTPSNCNGVEDDVTPESEAGEFDDPDTQQPPGVVCPPGEDEPADQEMTEFEVVGS